MTTVAKANEDEPHVDLFGEMPDGWESASLARLVTGTAPCRDMHHHRPTYTDGVRECDEHLTRHSLSIAEADAEAAGWPLHVQSKLHKAVGDLVRVGRVKRELSRVAKALTLLEGGVRAAHPGYCLLA